MIRALVLACLLANPVFADTVVATRTIPARSLIGPDDLMLRDVNVVGGLSDPAIAIGQEARVALYAGRPIRAGDLSAPAIVERNQLIPLVYQHGGVSISTEGRALERAGAGDWIRVMNLSSRTSVTAQIRETGAAYVAV